MLTAIVTSASLTDDVVTLATSSPHGWQIGFTIHVSGLDPEFTGTHTILAVPTATMFTFSKHHANIPQTATYGQAALRVTWVSVADVEDSLQLEPGEGGDYLEGCVGAANEYAWDKRSVAGYEDLPFIAPHTKAKQGTLLYATALFRERGSLDSFSSFSEIGLTPPVGTMGQINRLLGIGKARFA